MIKYIPDSENKKKRLKFFDRQLLKYYGLGNSQRIKIMGLFGLSSKGLIRDISHIEVAPIEKFIRKNYIIEDNLRRKIITKINLLRDLKLYKGFRHKYNLPVNGQRTRTNAQTMKKKKKIMLSRFIQDIHKLKIN